MASIEVQSLGERNEAYAKVKIRLRPEVKLEQQAAGAWVLQRGSQKLRFTVPAGPLVEMFTSLRIDGVPITWFQKHPNATATLAPKTQINRLAKAGYLREVLVGLDGRERAALQIRDVIDFASEPPIQDHQCELSHNCWARWSEGTLMLESLDSDGAVLVYDMALLFQIFLLADGQSWSEVDQAIHSLLQAWLMRIGVLEQKRKQDGKRSREKWEFHDMVIHARSRRGFHRDGYGATFVHLNPHQQPTKRNVSKYEEFVLERPVSACRFTTITFADVLQKRKSIRRHSDSAIPLRALGEFLFWTFRERERQRINGEEFSFRLYPAAGCLHEISVYLIVQNCSGLPRGLFRYEPAGHILSLIAPFEPALASVADSAAQTCGFEGTPHVIVLLTAQIAKVSRKYEAIAYSLVLKDVGVIYHAMYLVASALGLAPCALGGGGFADLSQWTGLSPWDEAQVGEFLVGAAANKEGEDLELSEHN